MLTSTGIGSGIDINSLVSDLVSSEGAPKIALFDKKEAVISSQISAFGLFKSALSELKSSFAALAEEQTYNTRTATSSDKSIFTASSDSSAVLGNYDIEVTQLAEAHKVSSGGFADSSAVVGTGDLTLTLGTDSFTLTIDDDNKTLAGIRDAINNATDNPGITATIINVDDGIGGTESRLVLSSDKTGLANTISVSAVNGGEGDLQQLADANLVERNPAQDSIVKIDNQTLTSSTNNLSNPIDGISISLLQADPGNVLTLDVSLNTNSVKTAITTLVENYNDYVETLQGITGYAETGSGALIGDALTRSANGQIRSQLTQTVGSISTEFSSLASIGIVSDRNGYLVIDGSKLDAAIGEDIDSIKSLFSADDGIATRLDNTVNEYVKANGILDSKTSSLNESINDINDQRVQLQLHLDALQARLLDQFIIMDSLVGQLNATSTSLQQAFANLPKPNSISKK